MAPLTRTVPPVTLSVPLELAFEAISSSPALAVTVVPAVPTFKVAVPVTFNVLV